MKGSPLRGEDPAVCIVAKRDIVQFYSGCGQAYSPDTYIIFI